MTTDRPDDELPEHERRPQTDQGGGIVSSGGTAPERRPVPQDVVSPTPPQPDTDIDDPEPEDPDGPEAAYQPRSL